MGKLSYGWGRVSRKGIEKIFGRYWPEETLEMCSAKNLIKNYEAVDYVPNTFIFNF